MEGSIEQLEALSKKYRVEKGNPIALLQDIQNEFGYIPEDAVRWIARDLGIPESRFFGIATFYAQFHLNPRGKNIITACSGTACHVKGSDKIINALKRELGLGEEAETTPDLEFTVEKVNCVGACSIAPVVIINKKVHGKSTTEKTMRHIKKLRKKEEETGEQ
jgi:NADH:ubiquinone oxidoreductase subunit E